MKVSIQADLTYSFAKDTQIIANIEAAHTKDQFVISEMLKILPPVKILREEMPWGDGKIRASLSGQVTIQYDAVVENNSRQLLPPSGRQHLWSDLPIDVLPFLLPSRYCPSDKFMRFVLREFGRNNRSANKLDHEISAISGGSCDSVDLIKATLLADRWSATTIPYLKSWPLNSRSLGTVTIIAS